MDWWTDDFYLVIMGDHWWSWGKQATQTGRVNGLRDQTTKEPQDQRTRDQGTKLNFFLQGFKLFQEPNCFPGNLFFPAASRAEPFLRNRTCCNVLQPEPKVTGTRTKPTSYSDQDSCIVFTTLTSPHPESSVQFTSTRELPFRPIVINWHASLQGLGISWTNDAAMVKGVWVAVECVLWKNARLLPSKSLLDYTNFQWPSLLALGGAERGTLLATTIGF